MPRTVALTRHRSPRPCAHPGSRPLALPGFCRNAATFPGVPWGARPGAFRQYPKRTRIAFGNGLGEDRVSPRGLIRNIAATGNALGHIGVAGFRIRRPAAPDKKSLTARVCLRYISPRRSAHGRKPIKIDKWYRVSAGCNDLQISRQVDDLLTSPAGSRQNSSEDTAI